MSNIVEPLNTPLIKIYDSRRNNVVYLKDESKQYTGAFKYRGVYNKFLNADFSKYNGVITSSTGNHGQAVSFAARQIGVKCYIVLPFNTPLNKKEKISNNGATIITGIRLNNYDTCTSYAVRKAKKDNLLYIPSFDDIQIINGHKMLFDEIVELPDYCFCPIGGGGLISAALTSPMLKNTSIIGVEIKNYDSMNQSLQNGKVVRIKISESSGSFCEGVLVEKVGKLNYKIAESCDLNISLVSINDIKRAINQLNSLGIKAEGAGACSYAAYLNTDIKDSSVLCVISGGNIDDDIFEEILKGECLD